NPAYPTAENQKQTGSGTWRCKECHGWDYQGASGVYGKGSHYTGIPGIRGAAGKSVDAIKATLRDENHPYTKEMISDAEMALVAAFVSRGQVDMSTFMDSATRKITVWNVPRGREIFQTVCAACHGFDGRALDWGDADEPGFVGTEAVEVPDEVFHKIYSSHPGAAMVNLRAFSLEDAIAVLSYSATLPTGTAEE
ncbi:MAG: cytochrome c, partial [Paracoccaceae bacterium]|nr:cytochrome c [Paracoccaceae bacterium]